MSTETTETKTSETETPKTIERGLQIRKFKGQIDKTPDEKNKEKKVFLNFIYPRVCFPWSRTGKDVDDKEVSGAVPTLAQVMSALQQQGYKSEFELDKENNPTAQTIVGLLVEGWNAHEQRVARSKAENTPESATEKFIQTYMKMMGVSREDAVKQLQAQFAGK